MPTRIAGLSARPLYTETRLLVTDVAVPSMRQRAPLATKRAVVIASVSGCGRSVIWVVAHEVAVQSAAATPGLRTCSASLMSWVVFGTVNVTVWPFVAPSDTAGPTPGSS